MASGSTIYQRKQNWKIFLIILAFLIVAISLWYSNSLVSKIANEERAKVELWAEAVQKKAKLVHYTDQLFSVLRKEERKKVELYVDAITRLTDPNINPDYTFLSKVIKSNTTVPVILTDENDRIKTHRNVDSTKVIDEESLQDYFELIKQIGEPIEVNYYGNQIDYVYYTDSKIILELEKTFSDLENSFIEEVVENTASVPVIFTNQEKTKILSSGNIDKIKFDDRASIIELINEMSLDNEPIEVELQEGKTNYIFYKNSWIVTQLKYFPLFQFIVIGIFMLISYFLFSTSRKAEQNQVWVGMAKETAHQLGTPLSSLLAWLELMKSKNSEPEMIIELEKDVERLSTITERFSKIGAAPSLEKMSLVKTLQKSLNYFKIRSPKKVLFELIENENYEFEAMYNEPLFEWVVENLIKNAIDAMKGNGKLTIEIGKSGNLAYVDISDTGKGVPTSKRKTIFEPGYTTKERGWGLGLSLSKRIIESYHGGKIFVKSSKVDSGTTFRILLKAS